jgi:CRP-like cAMP-binding protein
MYVVLSGQLIMAQGGGADGEQRVVLARFARGDVIGDLGVLGLRDYNPDSADRSSVTLEAVEDGEAWCVSAHRFDSSFAGMPSALAFMQKKALERRILKLSRANRLFTAASSKASSPSGSEAQSRARESPVPTERQRPRSARTVFMLQAERDEELVFFQQQHMALISESLALEREPEPSTEQESCVEVLSTGQSWSAPAPPAPSHSAEMSTGSCVSAVPLERLATSLRTLLQRLETVGSSFPTHAELDALERRFAQAEHHISTTEALLARCRSRTRHQARAKARRAADHAAAAPHGLARADFVRVLPPD